MLRSAAASGTEYVGTPSARFCIALRRPARAMTLATPATALDDHSCPDHHLPSEVLAIVNASSAASIQALYLHRQRKQRGQQARQVARRNAR